jgi:hypothetical protein
MNNTHTANKLTNTVLSSAAHLSRPLAEMWWLRVPLFLTRFSLPIAIAWQDGFYFKWQGSLMHGVIRCR